MTSSPMDTHACVHRRNPIIRWDRNIKAVCPSVGLSLPPSSVRPSTCQCSGLLAHSCFGDAEGASLSASFPGMHRMPSRTCVWPLVRSSWGHRALTQKTSSYRIVGCPECPGICSATVCPRRGRAPTWVKQGAPEARACLCTIVSKIKEKTETLDSERDKTSRSP